MHFCHVVTLRDTAIQLLTHPVFLLKKILLVVALAIACKMRVKTSFVHACSLGQGKYKVPFNRRGDFKDFGLCSLSTVDFFPSICFSPKHIELHASLEKLTKL